MFRKHVQDIRKITGQVSPMIIIIHRVSSIGQEVKAIIIINVSVVIIIDAIIGNLMMVDPHIALQVWVRVVYAGVNHADYHIL
jgi:hypothetical protein